jgi:hypothetical protein
MDQNRWRNLLPFTKVYDEGSTWLTIVTKQYNAQNNLQKANLQYRTEKSEVKTSDVARTIAAMAAANLSS